MITIIREYILLKFDAYGNITKSKNKIKFKE